MAQKTLKNKLLKLGISEEEAERVSEAKDILTKIENKLEIEDQSEHLATQADLLKLEIKLTKEIHNSQFIIIGILGALIALFKFVHF